MTDLDVVRMCTELAKEFPYTAAEICWFMSDIVAKDGSVDRDELRKYCRKRLEKDTISGRF